MAARAQRIIDFLEWLRDGASFRAADQQYLAAQDLLETMVGRGEWPVREDEWRTLLAPVLCSSAVQQEQFYDLFRTWFGESQQAPFASAITRTIEQVRTDWR